MADVKVLVIGDDSFTGGVQKGDVWDVVPSGLDWGSATVAPKWIRLTVKNVPGTQAEAEATIRGHLTRWREGFTYSEIPGAADGEQRYRVEVTEEIGEALPGTLEVQIRDHVTARFDGTVTDQQPGAFFEFDTYPGLPLDEIEFAVEQATAALRRWRFSNAVVDDALSGIPDGEPAEFEMSAAWVRNNILDKLKGG